MWPGNDPQTLSTQHSIPVESIALGLKQADFISQVSLGSECKKVNLTLEE